MMLEKLTARVESLLHSWAETKFGIEQSLPFNQDWLHFIVGPLIWLAAALITRKPPSSWGPWLVVAVIAVLNEVIDLAVDDSPTRTMAYRESATDFLVTIAIPTVLLVLARKFPLFGKRAAGR